MWQKKSRDHGSLSTLQRKGEKKEEGGGEGNSPHSRRQRKKGDPASMSCRLREREKERYQKCLQRSQSALQTSCAKGEKKKKTRQHAWMQEKNLSCLSHRREEVRSVYGKRISTPSDQGREKENGGWTISAKKKPVPEFHTPDGGEKRDDRKGNHEGGLAAAAKGKKGNYDRHRGKKDDRMYELSAVRGKKKGGGTR